MYEKLSIYYSVFAASAAVMGLEIIGIGMLAPYFGTALLVQTNLIGIVLICLAIGYRIGGIRSDRGIQLQSLYFLLLLAAGWVGIMFSLRDLAGSFLGAHISSVSLGSLLTSALLFGFPCVVLGMVLPYAIKLHVKDLAYSGKTSGVLYGISTVGSIFGTFAMAFFMLPITGYKGALFSITALLFAGAYLCHRSNYKLVTSYLLLAFVLLFFVSIPEFKYHKYPIFSDGKIQSDVASWKKLADETGVFSRVQVYEGTELNSLRPLRFMIVNGEVHSATYLDSNELVFKYAHLSRLGGHFNPAAKKTLLIGGGAYSYANYFLTDTPLYDVEKLWKLNGKLYHNNNTISLPILFTKDFKNKPERELVYTSPFAPVGGQGEGLHNHLNAVNQSPSGTVTILEADILSTGFNSATGYVQILETKDDGTPGRVMSEDVPLTPYAHRPRSVIGKSPLIAGENRNVTVTLDRPAREGEVLYAMLHRDNGNGRFDDFAVDGYEQIEALDVVEIDPRTTELAEKYFHLNRNDPRLQIFHEDGRTFINRSTSTYDIIYLDAFRSFYAVPWQLTTIEATRKIYSLLNDNGVVVANIPASLSGEFSAFFQSELKTYRSVFPEVRVYASNSTGTQNMVQNIIIVAFKSKEGIRDFSNDDPDINTQLEQLWLGNISPYTRILTDDFAPTDYYTGKFADLHFF